MSLIDNWDNDAGISEEKYILMQELTLDKVNGKIMLKIHHPFGLRPDRENSDVKKAIMEKYGIEENIKNQGKIFSEFQRENPKNEKLEEDDNDQIRARSYGFFKRLKKEKPKRDNRRARTKKMRRRKVKKPNKRFSDLVNKKPLKNQSQIYIDRNCRENYSGVLLKAQELEYLNLQQYGKRLASKELYNKNRIILGNFWIVVKLKECALRSITGGDFSIPIKRIQRKASKKIKNISQSQNFRSPIKLLNFNKQPFNPASSSSNYKLSKQTSSKNRKKITFFMETPRKEKNGFLFKSPLNSYSKSKELNKSSSGMKWIHQAPKRPRRLGPIFDDFSISALKRKEDDVVEEEKKNCSKEENQIFFQSEKKIELFLDDELDTNYTFKECLYESDGKRRSGEGGIGFLSQGVVDGGFLGVVRHGEVFE